MFRLSQKALERPNALPNASIPHFADGNIHDARLSAMLASLQFMVSKRLQGVLNGNYLSNLPGTGGELAEHRVYEIGDDIRRIDWNATARTTIPHVRQTLMDRELVVWLIVDLSPSINFGSTACTKRDMAILGAAIAITLAMREGNRIGAIISNGQITNRIPPRSGKDHANFILRSIVRCPPSTSGKTTNLDSALQEVKKLATKPGLITIISDFLGEITWEHSLKTLASRHSIIAIWVLDVRDMEIPALGGVEFYDPAQDKVREMFVDMATSRQYAYEAQKNMLEISHILRACRAQILNFRTDREWVHDMYSFIRRYRQVK